MQSFWHSSVWHLQFDAITWGQCHKQQNNCQYVTSPVICSVHSRLLKYCFIDCFPAQNYLTCLNLVCSLSSSSALSELIDWQKHLGSQWLICSDVNSPGWPISELWLSGTSVKEPNVGMRWFLWKQLLHRGKLCEDCLSSLRSFHKHSYRTLLEFFLNCKG